VKKLLCLKKSCERLDALLVSDEHNVSYLSGAQGIDARLLINLKARRPNLFITDPRFLYQAEEQVKGFRLEVIGRRQSYFGSLAQVLSSRPLKRIGFEAKALSFAEVEQLKKKLPRQAELVPTYDIVEGLRVIKDDSELKLIKKAADITKGGLKYIKKFVKPGQRECDIANRLHSYLRQNGAEDVAFPIIVVSGKRTAWPHAPVSSRKLTKNDVVVIDAGACFKGYNSDLTRTFFLGRINPTLKKCYEVLEQAQAKAIKAVRPGLKISQLDRVARSHIAACGFGKNFLHNLGHGVGLNVHEAPAISGKNKDVLRSGMVFTVEPGIYLPSIGGVRIEDVLVVTKSGCSIL